MPTIVGITTDRGRDIVRAADERYIESRCTRINTLGLHQILAMGVVSVKMAR